MRSYTNKNGEVVTVSEEHLQTVVRIKKMLQDASPSRRASWRKIVSLMEKEGFYDSESSENYRAMVKAYQKSIGELPEAEKHADMIADNKLKSITDLVGELSTEKRENQIYLREINKGKRELIDFGLLVKEIGDAIRSHDWSETELEYKYEYREPSDSKIVACLSDMHIGALVDTPINKYNFNIAVARIGVYASEIIREAKNNGINDIYVMNLGDVIEHSTMRYSQGFNAEFVFSEQIVRASDLIIKFLMFLAREGFNITYSGISGNHDRITDKDKNIDGDHAVKAINEIIKVFIENARIENITYEQAEDYSHSFTINNTNILALHGDLDNKNDNNLLGKHAVLNGIDYDLVLMGHYHTREIKELSEDKFLVVCGSLKGADEYSLNKLRKVSSPSQTYIIINKDGRMNFKWVTLK